MKRIITILAIAAALSIGATACSGYAKAGYDVFDLDHEPRARGRGPVDVPPGLEKKGRGDYDDWDDLDDLDGFPGRGPKGPPPGLEKKGF